MDQDDGLRREPDNREVQEALCSGSGDCEYPYCWCPRELGSGEHQRPPCPVCSTGRPEKIEIVGYGGLVGYLDGALHCENEDDPEHFAYRQARRQVHPGSEPHHPAP